MSTVSVSLPSDGSSATVAQYNTPITTIVNAINGGLDNTNIASGAAIATSKIATDAGLTGSSLANSTVTASKLATGVTSSVVATGESTASTSYVALATAQSFSVTVGANGILLIFLAAKISNTGANVTKMSFSLSGTNTLAASDANSVFNDVAAAYGIGSYVPLTGLTPGATTVTALFAVGAGTGTFNNRRITALPL